MGDYFIVAWQKYAVRLLSCFVSEENVLFSAHEPVARGFMMVHGFPWKPDWPEALEQGEDAKRFTASEVTEDILETLANAGITHLRVPVGYWYRRRC